MKEKNNKYFLFAGLTLLLIAIVAQSMGASTVLWGILFGLAILLKGIFLYNIFRYKDFKMTLWLGLILAGVVMILVSLLFKYVFSMPILYNILFYGAITLKTSGLLLLIIQKKRKTI